eukprot:scaffold218437_cov28-Tisochrysis_lutea.AAC.2
MRVVTYHVSNLAAAVASCKQVSSMSARWLSSISTSGSSAGSARSSSNKEPAICTQLERHMCSARSSTLRQTASSFCSVSPTPQKSASVRRALSGRSASDPVAPAVTCCSRWEGSRDTVFFSTNSIRVSSVLLTPVSPSTMHGTPHSIRSFMHSSFITKSTVITKPCSLIMGNDPRGKSKGEWFELSSSRCACSSMPRPLAR